MVDLLVLGCFSDLTGLGNHRCETCRAQELNLADIFLISRDDVLDPIDVWVRLVAVQREAVRDLILPHESWHTAEAIEGVLPI